MQIDERLGQAADTLRDLLEAGEEDAFDLAFIGAGPLLWAVLRSWGPSSNPRFPLPPAGLETPIDCLAVPP